MESGKITYFTEALITKGYFNLGEYTFSVLLDSKREKPMDFLLVEKGETKLREIRVFPATFQNLVKEGIMFYLPDFEILDDEDDEDEPYWVSEADKTYESLIKGDIAILNGLKLRYNTSSLGEYGFTPGSLTISLNDKEINTCMDLYELRRYVYGHFNPVENAAFSKLNK